MVARKLLTIIAMKYNNNEFNSEFSCSIKKTLEQVVVIKHSNFPATIAINYFEQQLLLYHIAMIALFYNSKIDITTYTESSCWAGCIIYLKGFDFYLG